MQFVSVDSVNIMAALAQFMTEQAPSHYLYCEEHIDIVWNT